MSVARRGLDFRQATREESSPLGVRDESPRTHLAGTLWNTSLTDTKKPETKKTDIQLQLDSHINKASQLQHDSQLRPSARAQLKQDLDKVVADAAIAAKERALPCIGSARRKSELTVLPSGLPGSARPGSGRARRRSAPDMLERTTAQRPASALRVSTLPVGETAQRRQQRQQLESYRASPLTIDNSYDNPDEEVAWDAIFAGPGVSPGTRRSRRSSRDMTASGMMASYTRHGLIDGAAVQPTVVAEEDMGQTGGDAIFAVVKAKMAARKRSEEQAKAEEEDQKSLAAASRSVMRKRALRESDLLIFRNIVAQLRKAHEKCAEAVADEPRLWNDWPNGIRDHVAGLVESISQQHQLLFAEGENDGESARSSGRSSSREPSPATMRPLGRKRAPAAVPRFTVLPADRDAEAGLLLESVSRAVEGVVSAYARGMALLDDASWRRARAFGSLEQAEVKAAAFDRWVRDKRSKLRELDLQVSEMKLEATRLPERPICSDVDVAARRKKARERKEGRLEPSPPTGTKGSTGPSSRHVSRVDRY